MGNQSSTEENKPSHINEEDPNMPGGKRRRPTGKTSNSSLIDDLNKVKEELDDYKHKYENTKEALNESKEQLRIEKEEVEKKKIEINNLRTSMKEELYQRDQQLDVAKQDLEKKTTEINDLRTRLSSVTAASLTNNNPNIVNLGDENRPTKLAEQYSQFYDNEWTDAICDLEDLGIKDREAIEILRNLIIEIFKFCEDKANQQVENLMRTMSQFMMDNNLPAELKQHLNKTRKENYTQFLPQLTKEMEDRLESWKPEVLKSTQTFRKRGLEICWLMCINDPPIYMDCNVLDVTGPFNKSEYKEYTSTGQYIDYVVWPAVFLFKGGSILCKGTAQGKN